MEKIIEQRKFHLSWFLFCVISLLILLSQVPQISASDLGLAEADCRCCHGTTLADRHHLLVNTDGRECLSCHSLTYNPNILSYDLTVTRDCPQCHTGSLADRHHLLVDQTTYDCFTCHSVVWDPATLQYVADFNMKCHSPTQQTLTGSIAGRITDQSGTGLGWAKVATSDGTHSTLATDTGNYELLNVPPGSYNLVATLDGFTGAHRNITVIEGVTIFSDFTLSTLQSPATISGFVRDANQAPLAGAIITSDNSVYSTLSSTDGSYSLGNIANGTLNLTTLKAGYAQVTHAVTVTAGETRRLDFSLRGINEICTDGIDNDYNGQTDCADTACITSTNCSVPAVEICSDGIDNNGNGLNDCYDPACIGHLNCSSPVAEICNDRTDNNGDGLLDCDDPLCNTASHCLPENCDDGIDNNGNQLIDCFDPVCANTSTCRPPPVEICNDRLDNDGDGDIDCTDIKCASLAICSPQAANELCRNGTDDNGDGNIDCDDTQCKARAVCLHESCNNAIDDDADGRIDCEDRECRNTRACTNQRRRRPLSFSIRASMENLRYKAINAGDKNQSTRWWGDENGKQWLMIDLGGIYPIDRVDISWHDLYADQYNIRVSKNGRYWKTVKAITRGDGGFDWLNFETRDARFILIECRHAIASGYSIYEVEVFRSNDETSHDRSTDTEDEEEDEKKDNDKDDDEKNDEDKDDDDKEDDDKDDDDKEDD